MKLTHLNSTERTRNIVVLVCWTLKSVFSKYLLFTRNVFSLPIFPGNEFVKLWYPPCPGRVPKGYGSIHWHLHYILQQILTSQHRVLNLILTNLILLWLMNAAILRPPNTRYTQKYRSLLGKATKNSKNNITAIQIWFKSVECDLRSLKDDNYEWLNDFIWMENKQTSVTKTRNMSQLCDFIMTVSVDNYFFQSINILKILWRSYCQKITMT